MSELDDNEANAKPAGGYEVGYGKPPATGRFKPGQSGNPRGREKNSGHVVVSFLRNLKQEIRVTKGGVAKNITKEEAALRSLIKEALQGNWNAFMQLMKMGAKLGIIRPVKLPDFRGGVVCLPIHYWHTKTKEEFDEEVRKEVARRNALWAQGLPYDPKWSPEHAYELHVKD
jgi:hypothetical protein